MALQPSLKNTAVAPKAAPPQPPPRTGALMIFFLIAKIAFIFLTDCSDLPKSGTGLAKALFDFAAEGPNEVSFHKVHR